jgi:nucleoside-diphosphate kinase
MNERTFIILKPDAVQKNIVNLCLRRFQDAGLILKERYKVKLTREFLDEFYKHLEGNVSDKLLENIKNWMLSDYVVVTIFEGNDAIKKARGICGKTNPPEAKPGTIRHDFSNDDMRKNIKQNRETHNIVHASGNKEEAEKEIFFFKKLVLKG